MVLGYLAARHSKDTLRDLQHPLRDFLGGHCGSTPQDSRILREIFSVVLQRGQRWRQRNKRQINMQELHVEVGNQCSAQRVTSYVGLGLSVVGRRRSPHVHQRKTNKAPAWTEPYAALARKVLGLVVWVRFSGLRSSSPASEPKMRAPNGSNACSRMLPWLKTSFISSKAQAASSSGWCSFWIKDCCCRGLPKLPVINTLNRTEHNLPLKALRQDCVTTWYQLFPCTTNYMN